MLLDEAAVGDARRLVATTDPATDIQVGHALGWFHWLRYQALSGEGSSGNGAMDELSAAQRLLKPVFERNPYSVPEPLQRWYLQAEVGSPEESWLGARRLPVFRATVRATIDRAPANQPERTRFLLDTALMLRRIAGRSADEAVLAAANQMTLAALGAGHAALPASVGGHLAGTLQRFLEPVQHEGKLHSPATPASLAAPAPRALPQELAAARAPISEKADSHRMAGSAMIRPPDRAAAAGAAHTTHPQAPAEPDRRLFADFPERVGVGQRIPLFVWVSTLGGSGASAPLRPILVPPEGRRIVVAISAPGFELLSDADQELLVPATGESNPIRFALRATAPGLHRVKVDAFASGTFLGRVELQVSADVGALITEGVPRQVGLSGVSGQPGEVTLQVNREPDGAYSFQLIGASWYPRVPARSLGAEPTEVVERIIDELRAIARGESGFTSPRAIRERVKTLGTILWSDIVPDPVRRQFWEQAGSIRSFVVMSNLDTVPWELLHAVDQGRPEVGFIAEHVPVVRRVYERVPVYNLPLPSSAYVVPPQSPSDALAEVSDVRAIIGQRVRDLGVVSRLDDLQNYFSAPPGLLHFACHNTFSPATGSMVRMDGGPIRPDDLEQCKRRLSMADANPLIFFNACRTAGEIYGFTQMSGWASQFMAAGAGAFIGTLWPVRSATARSFATSFYSAIVHQQLSLGEATLQARKSVSQDLEDPTWLAYSVYGSPGARVPG